MGYNSRLLTTSLLTLTMYVFDHTGASLDITNSTMNSTIDDTFFIVDESEEEVSFRIPPESAKKARFIGGRSAIMNKSAPKPKFDLLAAAETKKTKSAKPKRSKAGKAKNLKK